MTQEKTGGTGQGHRTVSMRRLSLGRFEVTNPRGGTITIGGEGEDFSAVELFLTAIAGCTATDVDYITSRRAEPVSFEVRSSGEKTRSDEEGNVMEGIEVVFHVRFPDGPEGDRAREMLPRAVSRSHDRLCTVSRTVELGRPVSSRIEQE